MESNNGSKPAETVECKSCDGQGWISVGHQQEQCPYCYATGEEPNINLEVSQQAVQEGR
jgi:RecJ-like exonuclease